MNLILQDQKRIFIGEKKGITIDLFLGNGSKRCLIAKTSKRKLEEANGKPVMTQSGMLLCKLHKNFLQWKPLNETKRKEFLEKLMAGKPNELRFQNIL